jgi:hypothetical protein
VLAAFAIASAASSAAVPAHAECGHARVTIMTGSDDEKAGACKALNEVLGFFAEIGFRIDPEVSIFFSDQVFIDLFGPTSRSPTARGQVSGYYDAGKKKVEVTTGSSRHRKNRRPWNESWGPQVAYSILHHEITHMAIQHSLGERYGRMAKAWVEFMAYSVQFYLMDAALRERILTSYTALRPIERPEEINPFLYIADPDAFAVAAFLYCEAHGGRALIGRLLSGTSGFNTDELLWVH